MPLNLVGFHVALFALAFLVMVNGYLRGAQKAVIAVCVIVPVPILLGVMFFISGWVTAIVAAAIYWLIYLPISTPLAKSLAFRILGYRTSLDIGGFGPATTEPKTVDDMMRQFEARDRRLAIRLGKVAQDYRAVQVFRQHGFSSADLGEQIAFLKEQLSFLMRAGVDEEVALDLLGRPRDLDQLLLYREQGVTGFDAAARLKCL